MTPAEHPADQELAKNLELAAKLSHLLRESLKPVHQTDKQAYMEETREVISIFKKLPEARFVQVEELISNDPEATENLQEIMRIIRDYNSRS